MKKRMKLTFISLLIFCTLSPVPLRAALQTIYIKPFAIVQGVAETDPIGNQAKDYIAEYIIEKGGYTIISDDEVKQVINQEELEMSLTGCYDDACIKKLMQSIKTDYIIYGTVSYIENKYYVTAKILDRTSGTVILSRIKTIKFVNRDTVGIASKAVGEYLITGDDTALKNIDELDKMPVLKKGRREIMVSKYPILKIGLGGSLYNKDLKEEWEAPFGTNKPYTLNQVNVDLFLFRGRYNESAGCDIFIRGLGKVYEHKEFTPSEFKKASGLPIVPILPSDNYDGELLLLGGDIGMRYINGIYKFGIHWQGYVFLAYQRLFMIEESYNIDAEIDLRVKGRNTDYSPSNGAAAGIGGEIGLLSSLGLFFEVNYGYSPVEMNDKKINVDGFNLIYGISFRAGEMW